MSGVVVARTRPTKSFTSGSSEPLTSGTAQRWVAAAVLIAAALYLPLYFFLTTRRALMRWLPADVGIPPLRLKIELTLVSLIDWLLAAATLYACIYLSGEHVKHRVVSAGHVFMRLALVTLAILVAGIVTFVYDVVVDNSAAKLPNGQPTARPNCASSADWIA